MVCHSLVFIQQMTKNQIVETFKDKMADYVGWRGIVDKLWQEAVDEAFKVKQEPMPDWYYRVMTRHNLGIEKQ